VRTTLLRWLCVMAPPFLTRSVVHAGGSRSGSNGAIRAPKVPFASVSAPCAPMTFGSAPEGLSPLVGQAVTAQAGTMNSALRVSRHRVRTAVWTLVHPITGRTVTLAGTMHIGDTAYFRALSVLLNGLAVGGAEIHVEGIARRDGEHLSRRERNRLAEAETWNDAETAGAAVKLLRLQSQGVELRLPEGARNIDLSHAELLRRVGWRNYRRLFAVPAAAPASAGFGPVVRAAIRFQLRHSHGLDALRSLRPRNRRVNRVVMGERNRCAFDGATDALNRSDVVLVWGTDHLPGLADLFTAEGYRLSGEAWFEACRL